MYLPVIYSQDPSFAGSQPGSRGVKHKKQATGTVESDSSIITLVDGDKMIETAGFRDDDNDELMKTTVAFLILILIQ